MSEDKLVQDARKELVESIKHAAQKARGTDEPSMWASSAESLANALETLEVAVYAQKNGAGLPG